MTNTSSNLDQSALVCIDFINDIVDAKGKLAGKGYSDYVRHHGTLEKVADAQDRFRDSEVPVIHVRIGFSATYAEQPKESPLFGKADEYKALMLDSEGTVFPSVVAPISNEPVLTKHRVSAFYETPLELILRTRGVRTLYIAGVATDLAVQSAARDAHDRDFYVVVLEDCCAAASDTDHATSISTLGKIAKISTLAELT